MMNFFSYQKKGKYVLEIECLFILYLIKFKNS